jgi:hypothetical protein
MEDGIVVKIIKGTDRAIRRDNYTRLGNSTLQSLEADRPCLVRNFLSFSSNTPPLFTVTYH